MSNIEISRELAIQLLQSAIKSGNEQEKEELRKLLYPEPVTVKDYMDAGRGDEIKPGMWVEYDITGTLFILRDAETNTCEVFNTEWGEDKVFADIVKPLVTTGQEWTIPTLTHVTINHYLVNYSSARAHGLMTR